jgi:DNA-binding SARP family transcriptional activator
MSPLKLFFFGTPRVKYDDQPVQIRRRKGMALLAYLTINGRPYSREALATLLWPEFDQSRALGNLRREISRLKQDTKTALFLADRKQLALAPELKLWVDVEQFKKLLAIVHEHDHFPGRPCETCLASLTEAATLYTEDFMTGFTLPDAAGFDEWHFFEKESLRQSLSDALQKLIARHDAQAEYDDAIIYARRWLETTKNRGLNRQRQILGRLTHARIPLTKRVS